jgi:nitrite reductase/ring-hydroxylating ferredoxin subunit
MAKRFSVAKVGELKDGMKEEVSAGETRLVLVRVGDHYYAFQARCPHWGWPLVRGKLTGTVLECAFHRSRFDISDGRVIRWTIGNDRPAKAFPYGFLTMVKPWKPRKLKTYKVFVEGKDILVEV